jgi:hypothetical protein
MSRAGLRVGGLTAAILVVAGTAVAADGVSVRQVGDKVRVEMGGELFTEYHYQDVSRPFLYPVLGPDGLPMTRNWPMREVPGENQDHPHHRSLWYAHGDVNGVDLWSESSRAGRTRHMEFLKLESGPEKGVISALNRLESREGKVLGTDVRTMTFSAQGDLKIIDFDVNVLASHGDLVFGDTKEGTMAIRLAETMRLKPNQANVGKPTGHIVNSEGVKDGDTWGKRAKWVDYTGPVEGRTVGVAIFDHPENPRHPTWWHVRDYGLFAANAFGVHDFERKPAGTGDLEIPNGESRTWRFRFVFHPGDTEATPVERLYDAYVGASAGKAAVPAGYELVYSQDFSDAAALNDFEFSDPAAWRFGKQDGRGALELHQQSKYRARVRSPFNIALIRNLELGDFVLEADLIQTGREYGHRDMCVFFAAKDPSNFYYVHMATAADPHAHNIFLVNDEPRVAIAQKTTEGVNWGLGIWHRVRIERTLEDGAIRVFFDDLSEPIMVAKDQHFDFGRVGFGSFDDTGMATNIRIWAPAKVPKRRGFFE